MTNVEPVRVLHVDDDPEFAEMAGIHLERESDGFSVTTESDPRSGVKRLNEEQIDCIVSDYEMPGTNGLEFLSAVRENHPELPFILFTGKGNEEIAAEAISAGVTEYLQKAGGIDQYTVLANRIRNAVTQYRAEREVTKQSRINALINEVNQALVRALTRDDLEAAVCDILCQYDPYVFAWFGDYESDTGRITPRTTAGNEAGYLDQISPTAAKDPAVGGLAGRAVQTESAQFAGELRDHPAFDTRAEAAMSRGFRAATALPLVHADEVYGVICIYTSRPDVFDEAERTLLEELRDDTAHALHAIALREELAQYKRIVETVPEGVFVLDADGTIAELNDTAASIIGYSEEDVSGSSFPTLVEEGIFEEDIIDWYLDVVPGLLSQSTDRESALCETEVHRPDGRTCTCEVRVALRPFDEEFRGTIGIVRENVTQG